MTAKGDLYRVKCKFRDPDTVSQSNPEGTLISPTTVVLSVKDPAGVITTPAVTMEAVGIYRVIVSITQSGTWTFRWASTGTGQAATPDFNIVAEPSVF